MLDLHEKNVTLYLDDVSLRLMMVQGQKIRQWAFSPLKPGLVRNNVIINKTELARLTRQLLKANDMKSRRIAIGISGLHCLTRPMDFPKLPEKLLDEAVNREARRVLPLPPEQLYLSWQITHQEDGRLKIYLVAIPRKTVDSVVQMLHIAGLKPTKLDIKPLLLTRTIRELKAVLVDMQATEFDIVVLTGGIPQPVRTTSFAGEELNQEERLAIVSSELDRTIAYYDTQNPEDRLEESVPIYVSGDLAKNPQLWRGLSEQLGHPIKPLSSPFESPPGFDSNQHIMNISSALPGILNDKTTTSSQVNMNTLPETYRPKPISPRNIVAPPGAVVGAGLLAFLIFMTQNVSAGIVSLNDELQTTELRLRQNLMLKEELTREVNSLESQIIEVEAARDSFATILSSIKEQGSGLNNDLTTVRIQPNKLSLSGILHSDGVLTVSGQADSEKTILSYLQDLNESGRFGEIVVTNMLRSSEGDMEFTLAAELKQPSSHISGIEAVLGRLPAGVKLTDVSTEEGTFIVYGTSSSESLVLSYLQELELSRRFEEMTISKIARTQDGGIDFSLVLEMKE